MCIEVWVYEGWVPFADPDPKAAVIDDVAAVANWIPVGVELGFHLCYGDSQHEHLRQPDDTANVVGLVTALAQVQRPSVAFLHMPVPINCVDSQYFEPLSDPDRPRSRALPRPGAHPRRSTRTRRRINAVGRPVGGFGVGD